MLSEASKVWEQLKHGSGSMGEGGPSMTTHLPVSLEAQLRNNLPGTSGKYLLSLGFLCSSVLDGLMNSPDLLLCNSSTDMADLCLVSHEGHNGPAHHCFLYANCLPSVSLGPNFTNEETGSQRLKELFKFPVGERHS